MLGYEVSFTGIMKLIPPGSPSLTEAAHLRGEGELRFSFHLIQLTKSFQWASLSFGGRRPLPNIPTFKRERRQVVLTEAPYTRKRAKRGLNCDYGFP